jgi:hypothetical protein
VTLDVAPPNESFVILLSSEDEGDTLALKYIRARVKGPSDSIPPPD